MQNYFETQKIHWHNFSPENIIFKSNNITKKLMPSQNVMSYTTKSNRDDQMAKKSGATSQTSQWGYTTYQNNNHVGVHVKLTDIKRDFVGADVDFIDLRTKKNSVGGHRAGLDILVYIQSHHNNYQWQRDAQGNWVRNKTNSHPLSDEEGYLISYGGQGDRNPMTHREFLEVIDISEAIRRFLIDRVMPLKRGELKEKDLTLVA
jgi:hypothetical protein